MTLVLASTWASPDNRRREALRAAHTQNAERLTDLLTFYLQRKTRGRQVSPQTLRNYSVAIRDFLDFTGPPDSPRYSLQNLTAEDLEAYLEHSKARARHSATPGQLALGSVGTYLYGVRALYRALTWAGAVTSNPTLGVSAPRDPTPAHTRKRAVPRTHYRALLDAPDPTHAARDAAILTLGATLGLRAQETVRLGVGDVQLSLRELHVRHGKGGKERRIPLPAAAAAVLARWLEVRRGLEIAGDLTAQHTSLIVSFHRGHLGKPLTTAGLRTIVNRYLREVGLPPDMGGVHTLRRTAGTRLYRATRDLHVVADILGHASVTTSAIYAKLDVDVRLEALEAADQAD
ncbi:tyrosine-type recombinase/integrase [Deinococcus hopiensis]|uniref:Integrase/recombinase XerC n=1 Tax=Deinococcus hopiensis KR-140 TaxID=695939 RepID=A0A1W1VU67_9DEIO|nr:tyrosine-type recombinase/integrase [Deinococcus hopiensis]SMB96898.1 integrase/recombinase XerC [Deinococcus hopiensis KR-140]